MLSLAEGGEANLRYLGKNKGLDTYGQLHDDFGVKGRGYFGPLKSAEGYSTEISSGDDRGGYPLMVPTLSRAELASLLAGEQPSDGVFNKAQAWADQRRADGLSPFNDGTGLYYPEPQYADGGEAKLDVLGELKKALVDPMYADFKQGNKAVKQWRDEHPTTDAVVGLDPRVSALQVANDYFADELDGGTALNVAQAIPLYRQLGTGVYLGKQAVHSAAGSRYVYDAGRTMAKNAGLTAVPVMAGSGDAFARGGLVKKGC